MKISAYAVYVNDITLNDKVLNGFEGSDTLHDLLGRHLDIITLPQNAFMIRTKTFRQLQELNEKLLKIKNKKVAH